MRTIHSVVIKNEMSSGCSKKTQDRTVLEYDEYEEEQFGANDVDYEYPIIYDEYFYEHENGLYSAPLFDGRATMTARMLLPAKRFDIWAEVSAVCGRGTLMSASGVRDYLWLGIIDGKVEMRVDAGSGPLQLRSGKVNIDNKSKLWARRYKKDVVLNVGSVTARGTTQGRMTSVDVEPFIHIGHPPLNDSVLSSFGMSGFVGCVHRLRVNGREVIPPSRGLAVASHGLRACTPQNLADLVCP